MAFFESRSFFVLVVLALILASATAIIYLKFPTQELKDRVNSWWYILGFFTIGIMLNTNLAMFFFGFLSFLALKEYFTLIPSRQTDRRVMFHAYMSIPFQYYFAGASWYGMFIIWIPVYLFLLLPFRQVIIGETKGFLENTARVQWGVMLFVFSLSHLAYMLTLEPITEGGAGGKSLFSTWCYSQPLTMCFNIFGVRALENIKSSQKLAPIKQ